MATQTKTGSLTSTRAKVTTSFAERPAKALSPTFRDDDLVTVLYGYGKVAPTSRSYLDDYLVEGGVIRNVPYRTAKHWKAGTRPDGLKAHGRVNITIMARNATEEDFLAEAGLSSDELKKLAMRFRGVNAQDIIDQVGPDGAKRLLDALTKHFSQR